MDYFLNTHRDSAAILCREGLRFARSFRHVSEGIGEFMDTVSLTMELILIFLREHGGYFHHAIWDNPSVLSVCFDWLASHPSSPIISKVPESVLQYYRSLSTTVALRAARLEQKRTVDLVASEETCSAFAVWVDTLLTAWLPGGLFSQFVAVAYSVEASSPAFHELVVSQRYSLSNSQVGADDFMFEVATALTSLSACAKQVLKLSNMFDMPIPDFERELFGRVGWDRVKPPTSPTGNSAISSSSVSGFSGAGSVRLEDVPIGWLPSCVRRILLDADKSKFHDRKFLAYYLTHIRPKASVNQISTELGQVEVLVRERGAGHAMAELHTNTKAWMRTYRQKSALVGEDATSTLLMRQCGTLIEEAQSRWNQKLEFINGKALPEYEEWQKQSRAQEEEEEKEDFDIEDVVERTFSSKLKGQRPFCPVAYRMLDDNTIYVMSPEKTVSLDAASANYKYAKNLTQQVLRTCLAEARNVPLEQQQQLRVKPGDANPFSMWTQYAISKLA
jgi:hypothetical protein